jgi:uncharacterized membrane protein YeaQ/YmgE (transglycosylase-associated protein family)
MNLVYFLLIGLVAGWIAGFLTKGKGFGIFLNLLIGVLGAVLGGFFLSVLGFEGYGVLAKLATAVIGALVLLWFAKLIKK